MDLVARRRRKTQLDIEIAAVELFEQHGFEAVTVDQIAAAAGVSVRTFYRYCSSKEDALTSHLPVGARDLAGAVSQASEVPFLYAVRDASTELMLNGGVPISTLRRVIALCLVEPQLRTQWMAGAREAQDRLADVVYRRQPGLGPERATVLAGTVVAALAAAYESWARDDYMRQDDDMREHVTRCISVIEALFPAGQLPD